MKKLAISIMSIIFIALLPTISAGSGTAGISPPLYETSIKVKLLPEKTFSAKIFGSYHFVNLDDQSVIPYTTDIIFEQQNGIVIATTNGDSYESSSGYGLYEVEQNDQNAVEISNIQTSSGPMPVQYRGSFSITPQLTEEAPNLVNTLHIEDYIKGVVPSEMPSYWPYEALKAQAVAARSYAFSQMQTSQYLNMTVASQVYRGKTNEAATTNQAIAETNGVFATYNNEPIQAFFHASSGGYTENSEDVWSNPIPYIRAVEDSFDQHPDNTHYGWSMSIPATTITNSLFGNAQNTLLSLKVTERSIAGAVQQMEAIVYDNERNTRSSISLKPTFTSSSDGFRTIFGEYLKSSKFTVTGDAAAKIILADGSTTRVDNLYGYELQTADNATETIVDDNITLKTKTSTALYPTFTQAYQFSGDGWGHGLGMSQWGARSMASAGYTYDQILKHYYIGIEVR
ncbi:SpoIID/LytB domain-containing protein [Cytobacillus sp. IB215316]|uniref:SpoIID/LytB domain-containing protein n=1 Tax=Cytobacillus sp. IB215316 TaxID=3097354 RepID=UPI002A18431A|nr:SpoIID/LytB domain-containing protein [Cytobacillus sp. IB215316]MDX8361182.1 SpoIID/LytB domain-containing protein [Cytobacillus sp. IB215316]